MARVLCPESAMQTRSGMPARTMLRTAERRKSCRDQADVVQLRFALRRQLPVGQHLPQSGRNTRGLPRLPEIQQRVAVTVEHAHTIQPAPIMGALDNVEQLAGERQHAASLVLRQLRPESDHPTG